VVLLELLETTGVLAVVEVVERDQQAVQAWLDHLDKDMTEEAQQPQFRGKAMAAVVEAVAALGKQGHLREEVMVVLQ